MLKLTYPLILLFILVSLSCSSVRQNDASEMDLVIQNILDSADITGISICLFDREQINYIGTSGYRNSVTREKIEKNTIFEAASLGKPITAYCAMKLVEAGKLDLDTPMYRYLEYEPIEYDNRYKLITARMVLSHTSGFPNWRRFNEDNVLDIKFTPGTRFSYSGEGFVYLQKVMEKISGKGLDQLTDELLFESLGMDHSHLVFPETSNFATGHNSANEPVSSVRPEGPNAAGSMLTTAGDYTKFLQEILSPEFILPGLIDTMAVPHIAWPGSENELKFGLGLGLYIQPNDTLIWHWGDNDSFKAFFMISRNTGKGFVYFSNNENGLSIIDRLIGICFSINKPFWNNQYSEPEYQLKVTGRKQ